MAIIIIVGFLAIVLVKQGMFKYGNSAKDAKYQRQYREYNNLYWKNKK